MNLSVLDTDILTLYQQGHPAVCRHYAAHPLQALATTVLNVEEQLTGWYTLLRRVTQRAQLAIAYQSLVNAIYFLGRLTILSFTEPAILRSEQLAALKLNVRKTDLRIAAVTLENGAILVTRNVRDFGRIPGLIIEDWTV